MIRLAGTQDLTIIRGIVDAAYRHWFARTGRVPGPVRDDHAQCRADAQLWVLEVNGEIVGLVVLVERPDRQCQGYGRQLIAFAEQEAVRRGFTTLHLCTNVLMTENVELYQHLGYAEVGRIHGLGYERICLGKQVQPTDHQTHGRSSRPSDK